MDHNRFQEWLSNLDRLSPAQKQQVLDMLEEALAGDSLEAMEARMAENRQCPHCDTLGAVSRGKARGLRRYYCKGCKKTFNAATGTVLQGLHKKDRWLTFEECLTDGMTVQESAMHCNLTVSNAYHWRHRILGAKDRES